MSAVEVTTADMDDLLAFLPMFEDEQFVAVAQWNPWPQYTAEANAFFRLGLHLK